MTSRERWTIYPLLFLSLGMGLRSRMPGGTVNAQSVQCENLTITGRDASPIIRLGSTAANQGQIAVLSAGKPLLIAGGFPDGKSGQLIVQNAQGFPQLQLRSNGRYGVLEIAGPDGRPILVLSAPKALMQSQPIEKLPKLTPDEPTQPQDSVPPSAK